MKAITETLNAEGAPTLRAQVVNGSVAFVPDQKQRWTPSRVHDALHQRAAERFDSMTLRDKVEWVDRLAEATSIEPSRVTVLGHELRALAQSVGLGWLWSSGRPLNRHEVRRVHDAVREGMAALKSSKHVRRATADEIRRQTGRLRGQSGWGAQPPAGWLLPRHRIRLRLLPSPALGEETSVFATIDAADEVSAIVAALGYFYWRHADRWRECECGCGLTFVVDGKRRFIEGHGGQHRQEKYYSKNRDKILQERRQRRQVRQRTAGEAES